jgi:hypothetical protein
MQRTIILIAWAWLMWCETMSLRGGNNDILM